MQLLFVTSLDYHLLELSVQVILGTTNVLRIGGKVPAVITLAFDILKGLAPVIIARMLTDNEFIIACTALYAILGHVFPIFLASKEVKVSQL